MNKWLAVGRKFRSSWVANSEMSICLMCWRMRKWIAEGKTFRSSWVANSEIDVCLFELLEDEEVDSSV